MTSVKRLTDLTEYKSVLPYASELFGIYQPLLGWKSVRLRERYREAFHQDRQSVVDRLRRRFAGVADVTYDDKDIPKIKLAAGAPRIGTLRQYDSLVLEKIAERLPSYPDYRPQIWAEAIKPEILETILNRDVPAFYTKAYADLRRTGAVITASLRSRRSPAEARAALDAQLRRESVDAALLLFLAGTKNAEALKDIFYATDDGFREIRRLAEMLQAGDSLGAIIGIDTIDPREAEQLEAVALSPIAVVHLFRQYFFELDTFLGPPQGHVWLSPGSSVELIETHTRRSVVERTLATTLETALRSETSTTTRDEISEAVKEDNDRSINFGAAVKYNAKPIEATTSFDYRNSQKMAREIAHKQMREQTQKLSSEIRRNVTSTFKMLTEFTDVSSAKHVLANNTGDLINYEMRRKMRQIGVQVQDVGTFLSWQAYVDDPGRTLGLAELVHIAAPPQLDGLTHPEAIPRVEPFQESRTITIPFVSVANDADNEGEVYKHGKEVDNTEVPIFGGNLEKIQYQFPQRFICAKPDHRLTNVEFDAKGQPFILSLEGAIENVDGEGRFLLHLDSADFQGQNSVNVDVVLHWSPLPSANAAIDEKNKTNLANFSAEQDAAFKRSYVEAVKERVTIASRIAPRPAEDLREEERITVYRQLIQDMLLKGIAFPDDRTRHVAAELVDSIFDVEKMLYFVAPEWWRPRLHRSRQQLLPTAVPPTPPVAGPFTENIGRLNWVLLNGLGYQLTFPQRLPAELMSASKVGWGGVGDPNRDNYLITTESEPARLGSSLGWLLQLDGDDMRNAFLNAPWVKAVIPIRPGKEAAAINWLKAVEGMDGITDDAIYRTDNPNEKDVDGLPLNGQKMIDVLMDLAEKIRRKYVAGIETGRYPKQDEVADPALIDEESTVTATPIDRVYEHGFFPLGDSFRANVGGDYEIFDQWTEILPTDQSVPVEVAYDPVTGRQI